MVLVGLWRLQVNCLATEVPKFFRDIDRPCFGWMGWALPKEHLLSPRTHLRAQGMCPETESNDCRRSLHAGEAH